MYKIPARLTVAGVAAFKSAISNNKRISLVKAMRSLLASVRTFKTTMSQQYKRALFTVGVVHKPYCRPLQY